MLKIVFEKIWEDSLPLRWSIFITSLCVGIPWLVVITFKENSIWFAYLLCFLAALIVAARFVLYVGEIVDHIKSHLTKRPPDARKSGREKYHLNQKRLRSPRAGNANRSTALCQKENEMEILVAYCHDCDLVFDFKNSGVCPECGGVPAELVATSKKAVEQPLALDAAVCACKTPLIAPVSKKCAVCGLPASQRK